MSTAQPSREPTLSEVLRLVIRSHLADLWTAIPGVVEKYDKAQQKADIRAAVQSRIEAIDGEELVELPIIPNVPIMHPSGGGYMAAFPLAKGDPVLLVFSARSIDVWKSGSAGDVVDPNDLRQHAFADAFAIPGGRPFKSAFTEASDTDLVIGKDGGLQMRVSASLIELGAKGAAGLDFLAQAAKTKASLDELKNDLTTLKAVFSGWTPVAQDGGAALKTAAGTWYGTSLTVSTDVKTSKLKGE